MTRGTLCRRPRSGAPSIRRTISTRVSPSHQAVGVEHHRIAIAPTRAAQEIGDVPGLSFRGGPPGAGTSGEPRRAPPRSGATAPPPPPGRPGDRCPTGRPSRRDAHAPSRRAMPGQPRSGRAPDPVSSSQQEDQHRRPPGNRAPGRRRRLHRETREGKRAAPASQAPARKTSAALSQSRATGCGTLPRKAQEEAAGCEEHGHSGQRPPAKGGGVRTGHGAGAAASDVLRDRRRGRTSRCSGIAMGAVSGRRQFGRHGAQSGYPPRRRGIDLRPPRNQTVAARRPPDCGGGGARPAPCEPTPQTGENAPGPLPAAADGCRAASAGGAAGITSCIAGQIASWPRPSNPIQTRRAGTALGARSCHLVRNRDGPRSGRSQPILSDA